MGVIKFGGGTGDFIFRVVDGVPRAVPYAAITPYPDAVGGAAPDDAFYFVP